MYQIGVKRDFTARHFLIGGDWGAENQPHAHHYVLELELTGEKLNQFGYLVDIVEIEAHLERLAKYYTDQLLNDLPEFKGLNPSIEHFSRILCMQMNRSILDKNVKGVCMRVWENQIAWTSFTQER
jgi:6-pyruvoyltetrahydropterin/6-carboxytetrahydropterin synthase